MPMGFLQRAGFAPAVMDIAVENFDEAKPAGARFVGIAVPMHTALRLGVRVAERIREINPSCRICFYGLYAALNSEYLLEHGADFCIGGEYETPLVALAEAIERDAPTDSIEAVITRGKAAQPFLKRLEFAAPARDALPTLCNYAHLEHNGASRVAGYVEASRGCLHLCTHCPIPPVYGGRFFGVPQEVVLDDIRQQVGDGATHITFGDPDFLNGPTHSLRVVRAMHEEFPELTFDFTAKIEHLLNRGEHLREFAEAGCLFIISAVESLSNHVLTILDKCHTRTDVETALGLCNEVGITLRPTWVAFTPWTKLDDYLEMLDFVESADIIDHVDPVQFSIRLLIPPGSWIADLEETKPHLGELDEAAFTYRWQHPDLGMDRLQKDVAALVEQDAANEVDPATTFFRIKELAHGRTPTLAVVSMPPDRVRAPRLSESWFC
jgi:radical SAM superfamily enzyme YgiQ (UPF0313 family)